MILMLNQVLPRLYQAGDWHRLLVPDVEVDGSAGYFGLSPDYECIISATLNDVPIRIRGLTYETHPKSQGPVSDGVSYGYGLIDQGVSIMMSDLAETGADEFVFTSQSSFASGDSVTVDFNDTVDGRFSVTLPLNSISTSISSASSGGTGLTTLVVTSTTGMVANMGLVISGASVSTYNGTWRVEEVTDSTHIKIVADYTSTFTGTISNSTRILMPPNAIESVYSIYGTSLPDRVMMKDNDGIIYAILMPGDGFSEFRRYKVPQVPDDTDDEFTINAVCKRKFYPLVANTDKVYLDNEVALKYGFMAVIAEDNGELDKAEAFWSKAKETLGLEVSNTRGGENDHMVIEPWGPGISGMAGRY